MTSPASVPSGVYDEPPESYGGLLETDGAQKPGYAAFKAG